MTTPAGAGLPEPLPGLDDRLAHDLRQKLQTLILLQEMLAGIVIEERAKKLVLQIEVATDAMSELLSAFVEEKDDGLAGKSRIEWFQSQPQGESDRVWERAGRESDVIHPSTVLVVDDDLPLRKTVCEVLQASGYAAEDFGDALSVLKANSIDRAVCILIDACMPGIDGFGLLERLNSLPGAPNGIMMTAHGDIQMAVKAMRAGALDFLEKPFTSDVLLASVKRAVDPLSDHTALTRRRLMAKEQLALLTARQRQVLDHVLSGHASKVIARDLSISQRTVDNHRAAIMRKMGAGSLPALLRVAMTATSG